MNDKKQFSSYEKIVESKIIRIKHIIRIKLNQNAGSIKQLLESIPFDATVSLILGDGECENNEDYGEIVFVEEKEMN